MSGVRVVRGAASDEEVAAALVAVVAVRSRRAAEPAAGPAELPAELPSGRGRAGLVPTWEPPAWVAPGSWASTR